MSDLEQQRIRGEQAKQLLENTILREAFEKVGDSIEKQAATCDPDNAEKARRIIIAKQLLAGVEREIYRVVQDGDIAAHVKEMEPKRRLFKR